MNIKRLRGGKGKVQKIKWDFTSLNERSQELFFILKFKSSIFNFKLNVLSVQYTYSLDRRKYEHLI